MGGLALTEAVGRVESKAMIGTGFVIDRSQGLILTCRHVVKGSPTAGFTIRDVSVECNVEEAPPGSEDWALLTSKESLPAWVGELTLHRFRWNGCTIPFTSYGFATLYEAVDAGPGYVTGDVRGVIKADSNLSIDVRVNELAGKGHKDAKGLSGAPCLVNGVAVGLVYASLTDAVGSTMRAIPAELLHEQSGKRISIADAVVLPYEKIFISRFEQFRRNTLDLIAAAIDVEDTSGSDEVYCSRLARATISGGLPATVKALVALRDRLTEQAAKELTILAESLWIDALAAETAAMLATSPLPSGLLWNAIYDTTAFDLLRRACWNHRPTSPHWHHKGSCFVVHNPTGESHGSDLVREIAEHFKRELNMKTPGEIKQHLERRGPVIAVIFEPVPSEDVLAELERHYRGLRVLFIAAQHRADLKTVTVIRPDMSAQREDASLTDRELARKELANRMELVIDERDLRS